MRRAMVWAKHLGLMYSTIALTGALAWAVFGAFNATCLLFPGFLEWCLLTQQQHPEFSRGIEFVPAGVFIGVMWLIAVFVWTWWKAVGRLLPRIHGGPR